MNKKKGFTIVELLVASGILVMLLGGFLTTFQGILTMANYSEGLSFAYTACLNQLEVIINQDFNTIRAQGASWTFAPTGFPTTYQASGNVTVEDRPELYGGEWTTATPSAAWSNRRNHTSLVYDNKMWVLGGLSSTNQNDVWYSNDGATWWSATTNAAWTARRNFTSLVYDNKMWVLGGLSSTNQNDVWYSNDGATWWSTTTTWTARRSHTSLVYDNKMWVLGGFDGTDALNDVWYSTNGINWTQATPSAAWSKRRSHTSLVYDNKMWVMGSATFLNDVWYSTNGINWTQATPSAAWSGRRNHTSLVYDNKMWVLGGETSTDIFENDVWYSADGINWIQATPSAAWSKRRDHTSLVYDNRMWVMGGFDGNRKNDVWNSAGYDRLLEIVITVCWQQPNGRLFGEDGSSTFWTLNGIIDAGEDKNGNGRLDSPAQLRFLLSEKDMLNLRKTFLGRP